MAADREAVAAVRQELDEIVARSRVEAWDHAIELARRSPPPVSMIAREYATALASQLPPAAFTAQRRDEAREIGASVPDPHPHVGRLEFPAVRRSGSGCIVRVTVDRRDSDDRDEIVPSVPPSVRDAVADALAAARAATGVHQRLRVVFDHAIDEGRSAGLAVALAAASRLDERPISPLVLATGDVAPGGQVRNVDHQEAKRALWMHERPQARLLAPSEWSPDAQLVPVASLSAALDAITTQDPEAHRRALDAYRARLGETLGSLDLLGLEADAASTREITVATRVKLVDGLHAQRSVGAPQAEPLTEAYGEHPALVIVGEAGAGKSTALQILGLHILDETPERTPVHVSLAVFARALEHGALGQASSALRAYVRKQACDWGRERMVSGLGRALDVEHDSGRLGYLLDGLDEVPENWRARVWRSIEALAEERLGNRIVVSSRPAELSIPPGRWKRAEIAPLDERDATSIVEQEWARQGRLPRPVAPRGVFRETPAQAWIRAARAAGMGDLVSSPLFLRAMLLLDQHSAEGSARITRAEVLNRLLHLLLRTWSERRRLKGGDETPLPDAQRLLDAVAPVAFELFASARIGEKVAVLERKLDHSQVSFLLQAGVLRLERNLLRFRHSYLRDYPAARHLLRSIAARVDLQAHLATPAGKQVFLLAVEAAAHVDADDATAETLLRWALGLGDAEALVPWGMMRAAEAVATGAISSEAMRTEVARVLLERLASWPYHPVTARAAEVLETLEVAPGEREYSLIGAMVGASWPVELRRAMARRLSMMPPGVATSCVDVLLADEDADVRYFGGCVAAACGAWVPKVAVAVAEKAHERLDSARELARGAPRELLWSWARDAQPEAARSARAALLLLVLSGEPERRPALTLALAAHAAARDMGESEVIERVLVAASAEDEALAATLAVSCQAAPTQRILEQSCQTGPALAAVLGAWLDDPDASRRALAAAILPRHLEHRGLERLVALHRRDGAKRPRLALALRVRGVEGVEATLLRALRSTDHELVARIVADARLPADDPEVLAATRAVMASGALSPHEVPATFASQDWARTMEFGLLSDRVEVCGRAAELLWSYGPHELRGRCLSVVMTAFEASRSGPYGERWHAGAWLAQHAGANDTLDEWLEELLCDMAEGLMAGDVLPMKATMFLEHAAGRVEARARFSARLVRALVRQPEVLQGDSAYFCHRLDRVAERMLSLPGADLCAVFEALASADASIASRAVSWLRLISDKPEQRSGVLARISTLDPEASWRLTCVDTWDGAELALVVRHHLDHPDARRRLQAVARAERYAELEAARIEALRALAEGPAADTTLEACARLYKAGEPASLWRAGVERCLESVSAAVRVQAAALAWSAGVEAGRIVEVLRPLVDRDDRLFELGVWWFTWHAPLVVSAREGSEIASSLCDGANAGSLALGLLHHLSPTDARSAALGMLEHAEELLRDRGAYYLSRTGGAEDELLTFALRAYDLGQVHDLSALEGPWRSAIIVPWIFKKLPDTFRLGGLREWLSQGQIDREDFEHALEAAPLESQLKVIDAVPEKWTSPLLMTVRIRCALVGPCGCLQGQGGPDFVARVRAMVAGEAHDTRRVAAEILDFVKASDEALADRRSLLDEASDSELRIDLAAKILVRLPEDPSALAVIRRAANDPSLRSLARQMFAWSLYLHAELLDLVGPRVDLGMLARHFEGLPDRARASARQCALARLEESGVDFADLEHGTRILVAAHTDESTVLRLLGQYPRSLSNYERRLWAKLVAEVAEPGRREITETQSSLRSDYYWAFESADDAAIAQLCAGGVPARLESVLVGIIEGGAARTLARPNDAMSLARRNSGDTDARALARRWLYHLVAHDEKGRRD